MSEPPEGKDAIIRDLAHRWTRHTAIVVSAPLPPQEVTARSALWGMLPTANSNQHPARAESAKRHDS